MTTDWNAWANQLYRETMAYARELYEHLWAEFHPDGKPLLSTEITLDLLMGMSPEGLELLREEYPDEVARVLEGV